MKAPLFVRPLTDAEREQVKAGLRSSEAFTLRRCQILLASAAGATASQIARQVGCSDQAVRNVIKAVNQRGLAVLTRGSSRPKTIRPAFDAASSERLRDLLHRSPREFGKPTSLWTLTLAAEVSAAEGLTRGPVSGETVRATLARLGVRWQRAKQWLRSPDPEYARKKGGATG
jgi:transposase